MDKDAKRWYRDKTGWVDADENRIDGYPGEPTRRRGKRVPREQPFTYNENDKRIAMERLARQAGRPGFGNARAVRTFFDVVKKRQAKRLASMPKQCRRLFELTRGDLLGQPITASRLRGTPTYSRGLALLPSSTVTLKSSMASSESAAIASP